MISVLAAAWRVILKRTRADWLILAAAALIVLLATTLLSAGPIYASAVAISGLHRTLEDAPVTDANVQISARTRSADFQALDENVTIETASAFSPTGGPIFRLGRSDSFELPGQVEAEARDLTVFGFYEALDSHATLVEGAWPSSGSEAVQAVISESAAGLRGLRVGDTFELISRREREFVVPTQIVGIYRVNDPSDPYWYEDPLDVEGVEVGESFTTYGPLVVTPNDFFTRATVISSDVMWRIFPVHHELTVDEVADFRVRIENLDNRLNQNFGNQQRFAVDTELDDILREAERSLLVTRSGVMILTIQLAVLAGYALVLTAGLLIEQRKVETALLRSRGASNGQIATMALMEGLLLAVPAAAAGPWVAAFSLRLLNVAGPLTAIDLDLNPRITPGAYGLSALAALACVAALVLPAFLAARSFIEARQARGRQLMRGAAQRAGLDIALLVVAAIAYWQLRRYGAPLTESVQGRLGLDPLLVAAPAIGLLSGAVIALRLFPVLARVVDRSVTRSRGLVASLGAWQVARRPLRYTRSALLLMLALAIGLFAVSYTTTWTDSQRDQADYQTGADLRVSPDRRTGRAIPQHNLAGAYGQLDGVEGMMPVSRETTTISRSAGTGYVLGVDAAVAADVVRFRSDLSDSSIEELMQPLVERRPAVPLVELPGQPARLALDVQVALDPIPAQVVPPEFVPQIFPAASVVLRDARGLYYRLQAGSVAVDAGTQRQVVPLTFEVNGVATTPEFPLSIASVELRALIPFQIARTGRADVRALHTSPSTSGEDWQPASLAVPEWVQSVNGPIGLAQATQVTPVEPGPDMLYSFTFSTGAIDSDLLQPVIYSSLPGLAPDPETQPAMGIVVSDEFLHVTEAAVGDEIQIDIGTARRPAIITGRVEAFPTLDPLQGPILVADMPTVAAWEFLDSGRVDATDEWWLSVEGEQAEEAASTLLDAPYSSWRVFDRVERAETLRTDPVALGIVGALALGFVSAALFAALGFIVSAAVSARERLTEFALLRALGLSPRQLSGWLSLENGLLVLISLIGGTVLGLLISWLVLPFVTLTQDASEVVPGIIVKVPWGTVLLLESVTILSLAFVVALLALLLRRVGLGNVLRLGEE